MLGLALVPAVHAVAAPGFHQVPQAHASTSAFRLHWLRVVAAAAHVFPTAFAQLLPFLLIVPVQLIVHATNIL